jgi:hypothetical protein
MQRRDLEYWAFAGKGIDLSDVRQTIKQQEEDVREGLIEPLMRAADPAHDWDYQFITLVRQRTIRYPLSIRRWLGGWYRMRSSKTEHKLKYGA